MCFHSFWTQNSPVKDECLSYSHHIVPIAGLDVPEARRRRVVLDLVPELVAVLSLLLIGKTNSMSTSVK